MTLRTFHLIFILLVIMAAEMFAVREIWFYRHTQELESLLLGILSLAGGLGLCVYAFLFVRRMDRAGVH